MSYMFCEDLKEEQQMFGLISKKKIIKEALSIYFDEDTSKAWSKDNLMYRMGNANALNGLCNRIGVDLLPYVKEKYKFIRRTE